LPNIDQAVQRGWKSTIKLRALGGTIIELSKKQPLFVCHLSIFLSFESLKNLGILPEKKNFLRELASPPPSAHLRLFWREKKHQALFSDET
jgi:hypothetical protein